MKICKKLIWATIVLMFLSGCSSSYRKVTLPLTPSVPKENLDEFTVEKNSKVRIELLTGEKVSGTVVKITSDRLAIEGDANYRYTERDILFSDIANIEVEYLSDKDKGDNNGLAVAIILVTVVVAFLSALSSLKGMN